MQKKKGVTPFTVGTAVEVTSKEDGFRNSWYRGKITYPPRTRSSPKKRRNKLWVQYDTLVQEDDQSKPLKECVDVSFIRPLPPPSAACNTSFKKNDMVEACYRDGWWAGVVIDVVHDGLKYLVAFDSPYEEILFERDELRTRLEWIGGKWIRPLEKVFLCAKDASENDVVLQLEPVPAKHSPKEITPSSSKKLKQATKDNDGGQPLNWEIAVQALEAQPHLRPCLPTTGLTPKPSELDSGSHSILKSYGHIYSRRSSSIHHESNEKNDGLSYEKNKRERPPKKAVQRFLSSLQQGDEPVGERPLHGRVIEQGPASEAAGSRHGPSEGESPVTERNDGSNETNKELRNAPDEKVIETNDGTNEVQAGDFPCKALVLYSESTIQDERAYPAVLCANVSPSANSLSWPFTKRSGMWKVIDSMEVFKRMPQMPHFSPLNACEESSREKIAIDMMIKFAYEVDRISEGPPADFKTTEIINSLDSLKELESHGFNTILLQDYLNELLKTMDRERELQVKLKDAETKIEESRNEKIAAETKMNELVEQMKSLEEKIKSTKSVLNMKNLQLARLEFNKGLVSGEIRYLQLAKKRSYGKCFSWM